MERADELLLPGDGDGACPPMAPIPNSGAAAVDVGDETAGERAATHEERDQALLNWEKKTCNWD